MKRDSLGTAGLGRAGGRRLRLLAYTDTQELGGADLSMAHLLERLDASIDVIVMGTKRAIVERVAAARPRASTRLVPHPRSGHDWRSLGAHVSGIRAAAPDIVHANLASPWSCQYCVAAAATLRRPKVVTVYQLPVPPISAAQRRAKRLTSYAVDRHVGVGERTSREVEALVGLAPGSVVTVHNGVPDQPYAPMQRPRPGLLVGAIGRLEAQKGFDVLVRAFSGIDDATLLLIGEGSERAGLEQLARALRVDERIAWTGWSEEPRAYLPAMDVFVLPSRFEGFPLVVLEALLARAAVVATDVGSVAEAVRDGETGLLVPPDDPVALATAIRRLLHDEALRLELGENGRRLVLERFTAEHMTRGFESLYDKLLR